MVQHFAESFSGSDNFRLCTVAKILPFQRILAQIEQLKIEMSIKEASVMVEREASATLAESGEESKEVQAFVEASTQKDLWSRTPRGMDRMVEETERLESQSPEEAEAASSLGWEEKTWNFKGITKKIWHLFSWIFDDGLKKCFR